VRRGDGAPRDAGRARDHLPALAPALRAAARRHGTPLYVTDAAALDAAAEAVRAAFPDPWLRAYSLKANDLPALVARLATRGFGANVVSRGEWDLARRAGVANAAITFEGIGKADADLRAVVRAAAAGEPLRWIAVESADEAAALAGAIEAVRRRVGRAPGGVAGRSSPHLAPLRVDAHVRLNPSVEPETHAGLATGSRGSKFGVHPDEVGAVIKAGGGAEGPVRWRGIHLHVGSQLGAIDAWRDAVRRGLALLALLQGGLPDFDTLDVGGGMPVTPWRPGGTSGGAAGGDRGMAAPDPARFAAEVPLLLEAIPSDRRPRRLAVEPGRVMVASAGWLVARVLHVRERTLPPAPAPTEWSGAHALAVLPPGSATDDRTRRLVVIGAGMTELIRPALYGADHAVVALTSLGRTPRPDAAGRPTRVDGPICESTDTLGEHLLPPLRRGDLVAIADAGAYAASMRSTYNGRPRPAEVVVEADGSLTLARRRGTLGSLA
jgi:diaminopimelate decarboxylase